MRAAVYDRTGPARQVLQVREIDTPYAGAGEVRVRLSCSGVNPSDVKSRAGLRSTTLPFPLIVPHSDGAGVIDEVGDGVDPARAGQRVWVWNAAWGRALGTAAEYVVLPAEQAVELPAQTGFAEGACLGIPALTACHAIGTDGRVGGKAVLIAGGAGAVGHYAVQFARMAGARTIIATASSDAKVALARQAGAHQTINYRTEDVARRCLELTGGQGVDRVIELDLAANLSIDLASIRSGGEIVVYGSSAPEVAVPFFASIVKNARYVFFIVYNLSPEARARAISTVHNALVAGSLHHNIAERLPLARIAEAHELVESAKAVGNVVVDIE
jgi:NADPH:quinone reductase